MAALDKVAIHNLKGTFPDCDDKSIVTACFQAAIEAGRWKYWLDERGRALEAIRTHMGSAWFLMPPETFELAENAINMCPSEDLSDESVG